MSCPSSNTCLKKNLWIGLQISFGVSGSLETSIAFLLMQHKNGGSSPNSQSTDCALGNSGCFNFRLHGLNNRLLFLMVLEAGKPKIKVSVDLFPGECSLLACRQLPSPVSSNGRKKQTLFSSSFYKGTNPIMGGPLSWPHINVIAFQRPLLQTPSHRGPGYQHMNLRRTHIQSITTWVTTVLVLRPTPPPPSPPVSPRELLLHNPWPPPSSTLNLSSAPSTSFSLHQLAKSVEEVLAKDFGARLDLALKAWAFLPPRGASDGCGSKRSSLGADLGVAHSGFYFRHYHPT